MRLSILLALALPVIHGATLTYPDNIDLFEFSWTNPDQGSDVTTGPADGTLMTDGVTTSGSGETLSNVGMWGDLNGDTTTGMDGTFQATTLNVDAGFTYWSITTAEVVFDSGSCFTSDTTASAFYYDRATGTREELTATSSNSGFIYTFSADITTALETNGYIGFDVTTNAACEGSIEIVEFTLDGEQIATAEPTANPSGIPTVSPTPEPEVTTSMPTTAPPTTTTTAPPTTAPPTTPSPTTPSPTTPSPTTPSPTTPSPTTTTTTSTTTTTTETPITTSSCDELDFRLSIQLSSGSCNRKRVQTIQNEGEIRYTDYLSDGGAWSVYAGTSKYSQPDAFRIGIAGDDLSATGFCFKDIDVRFCIQVTDGASDSSGNTYYEGVTECTLWASEGGGWSEFAGDSDNKDFEAVRVFIDTQDSPGLLITDIMTGAWLSDSGCKNINKAGDPVYTNWLSWNHDADNWSSWGSDNDWNNPDAVAIYLGVVTNQGTTVNAADAFTAAYEYGDEDSGISGGAVAAVVCIALFCCLAGIVGFVWYRKRNKVLAAGVDDEDIGTFGDTTTAGYDMEPIGVKNVDTGDMEQEIMIEVAVTETNH